VACRNIEVLRQAPERRHYERVVARYWRTVEWTNGEMERLRSKLRRIEVFLHQQATRAERIVAEVSSRYPDSRVRAQARLDLIDELAHVLKADEPA
jgi:hypothetical protein